MYKPRYVDPVVCAWSRFRFPRSEDNRLRPQYGLLYEQRNGSRDDCIRSNGWLIIWFLCLFPCPWSLCHEIRGGEVLSYLTCDV